MNRVIVYPGAIPQDTDMLSSYQDSLIAAGFIMQAAFGSFTSPQPTVLCDGLACTPATPTANETVIVGAGSIMALETVDSTAYGSLGTNTAPLVKMGINLTSTTVNLAGLISGLTGSQFMNCLIQVQFNEADGTPIVLPYYNASNPSNPYSGPGNDGVAQNTVRAETVSIAVIAGTTNSLAVPTPTTGWTGLYSVYIYAGQTQVVSSNIVAIGGAPFIGTKIGQLRRKMSGNTSFYVSAATGASDSNSGLSTNNPFATLQGAWNSIIANWDLNGYSVTINIGAGTFSSTGNSLSGQPTGFGASSTITINGAGSTTIIASTGTLSSAISASNGANIIVTNLEVTATGTTGSGIQAYGSGSQITDGGGIVYGPCSGAQRSANGGIILITGNSSITGAAADHFGIINGGQIVSFGAPVTSGTGALAFTSFANVATGNLNLSSGHTFSGAGSFTGQRYNVSFGGAINTGTSGNASYFPGSTAGTNNSGTAPGIYY